MKKNQSIFAALRGDKEPEEVIPLWKKNQNAYSVLDLPESNTTSQEESLFDIDGKYLGDKPQPKEDDKVETIEDIARRFEADLNSGLSSTVLGNRNYKTPVFIYGTLKKGGQRASLLQSCDYLGEYITGINYDLKRTGQGPRSFDFPVLLKNSKFVKGREYLHRVMGELYLVDDLTLNILDGIENVPRMYERKLLDVWKYDKDKNMIGDLKSAQTYIGKAEYWEKAALYPCEKWSEKAPHLFYPVSKGIVA